MYAQRWKILAGLPYINKKKDRPELLAYKERHRLGTDRDMVGYDVTAADAPCDRYKDTTL